MGLTGKQKQRIESVFHEALKLAPEAREKFLAKACADDDSVRREAASLLRHYESASDLQQLGKSSYGVQDELPLPERIGPYEVQSRLGRGGMGEVFLARDPRLGRKVAIKVLSPAIAETSQAMERLRREALAASALNHPNILTVYEFGEAEGRQYIVTEYVEGESLREKIGELSPEQALDYARQIAEALAAAHKAGIIHRDIKPENVMVRPDGYVKVLDFGLAKAAPIAGAGTTSIQQRLEQGAATAPGILIGTISYMSPEQVRGQEVDQRTDIWSWAVVLYEVLFGKRPFDAESAPEVLSHILGREPDLPRNSPLKSLLARALAKDPAKRYPEMNDALADLKQIEPQPGSPFRFAASSTLMLQRFRWMRSWISVAVMAAALGFYLHYWSGRPEQARVENMVRLTNVGNVTKAAISPEGDYVAYAVTDGTSQALRLRQISTGADTERLPAMAGDFTGITFAKGFIYYVFHGGDVGQLYRVPLLSGAPRLLAERVNSPVSFAPEFDHLVFMRAAKDQAGSQITSLITLDLKTGKERSVVSLNSHEHFWLTPLWSGDGKFIVSEVYDDSSERMKLMSIRVADGDARTISTGPWTWMRKPAWLRKNKSIIVATGEPRMKRAHLVEISIPEGRSSEIAGDLSDYTDVDSTQDGRTLVAVQRDRISAIWTVPFGNAGAARKLTRTGERYYGISWSPMGRLFSQAETAGRTDLWSVDASTGEAQAIVEDDSIKMFPEASPKGKYLIYTSNRDGAFHIWRSNMDGSGAARLTSEPYGEEEGTFTPDGESVVFTALHKGWRTLWQVSVHGGEPAPVTRNIAMMPSVSPNGKLIACEYYQEQSNRMVVAILKAGTGEPVGFFQDLPTGTGTRMRWSGDGKNLLYVLTRNGVSNIWAKPINGGAAREITQFLEDEIFFFAVSPDGRSLACIRGKKISDAILMRVTNN